MLGLTTFLQRSTTSLNQVSSFCKKLLHKYTDTISAAKNMYNVSTENNEMPSEIADDSTPLVKLNQIFQKVYELCFSKKETLYKSESLYTLFPDDTCVDTSFEERLIVVQQKTHMRNGIELSNSTSIMEEQNKGILTLFESVNNIFFTKQDDSNHRKAIIDAKKIGKPISKECIQHSNSEETVTSQVELVYYQSPNGEQKELDFKENLVRTASCDMIDKIVTTNYEVEGIGEVAVTYC
ncbi:MAG: hypothetical protein RLZZ81_1327 [Pseudomonadota bacterium]|jgi:hypothetical protein